ncbi:SAM-dependent methyltransferase [Nonomuraea sp. NPDC050478]|uniref:SAM-dependent methyltransferase n=1 Tax=Nonomuraea sp. NPDC050478 TaxID=3364365 RepID=UPI0037B2EC06
MPQSDPDTPNLARMYDYLLGGKDNFAVDREALDRLADLIPEAVPQARAAREFLQRAVRYAAAQGVTQFLDVGSGLPTQGNVHEVVPDARVVYVDHDPVVAAHGRELLEEQAGAVFVEADLLDPARMLDGAAGFLDPARPVGVLLVSVLHFVPDSMNPHAVVALLREALAPGSYLAIAHATSSGDAPAGGTGRGPEEIQAFFGDFVMIEPGLVQAHEWRPDRPRLVGATRLPLLAGMAWKP